MNAYRSTKARRVLKTPVSTLRPCLSHSMQRANSDVLPEQGFPGVLAADDRGQGKKMLKIYAIA
jgi:hypothetical protein